MSSVSDKVFTDWQTRCRHFESRCEELEKENGDLRDKLIFAESRVEHLESQNGMLQDLHRTRRGLPSKGFVEVGPTITEWTMKKRRKG